MRLIDVEKVVHEYYKNPTYEQLCKAFNEAPIVRAIPVDWINEWMRKSENTYNREQVYEMLKEWEKEND